MSKYIGILVLVGFVLAIPVYAVQYGRPDSDVDKGLWDDPNGNNDDILWNDIEETPPDDGDYIQSSETPDYDSCEVGLSSVTDPTIHTNHVLRVRYQMSETGGGQPSQIDLNIILMQGATKIASWLKTDIAATWTQSNDTLDTSDAENITDYTGLSVILSADQSGGARVGQGEVSWVEFEVPDVPTGRRRIIITE